MLCPSLESSFLFRPRQNKRETASSRSQGRDKSTCHIILIRKTELKCCVYTLLGTVQPRGKFSLWKEISLLITTPTITLKQRLVTTTSKFLSDLRTDTRRTPQGVLFLLPCARHSVKLKLKIKVLVAQWCPTICNLVDCNPPGSSVHGIL